MTPVEADHLARENLWRCTTIAGWLTRRRPWDRDEAISVALVGLASALATFDSERGSFGLHAQAAIRADVVNYLWVSSRPRGYRSWRVHRRDVPDVWALSAIPPGSQDRDAGETDPGLPLEWQDQVIAITRCLPPRHRAAIRCRYLYADAARDLAGTAIRLGCSRNHAWKILRDAMDMLRERYQDRRAIG